LTIRARRNISRLTTLWGFRVLGGFASAGWRGPGQFYLAVLVARLVGLYLVGAKTASITSDRQDNKTRNDQEGAPAGGDGWFSSCN